MRNFTKDNSDWFKSYWRHALGWSYVIICLWDFMLASIFFGILSVVTKTPIVEWKSLTLAEAGLYHISMLGILGITSYGRNQVNSIKASVENIAKQKE